MAETARDLEFAAFSPWTVYVKELHNLKYPFRTIPAMKIAKLAVDCGFSERYKGIGTFMITSAERLAWACNSTYCAARFLTVDADIEHDKGVLGNR